MISNKATVEETVSVKAGEVNLEGFLTVPRYASSIVVFVHGSGSSRHSPRNRQVASILNETGFATLLFDLLTPREEAWDSKTRHFRFDIGFLAERVLGATSWLLTNPETKKLRIGYFGASTGAAAALVAASARPGTVAAVVSRGGRPDLAGTSLRSVSSPTLLIVGEYDRQVIELNRKAMNLLGGDKQLVIVPGASHLFEEPGMLEGVAALAVSWFQFYLE